jgi:putative DNA primase/helicase
MHELSGQSPVLDVNLPGIPEPLKLRRQWVCWKQKFEDGKLKKVPVNPMTGRNASPTDSSTWGTFEQAWKYYERHKGAAIMGIGFVFTKDDPYAGVDLDKCHDPETGVITPRALEIVKKLNSYTELSPSGRGLHIIVFGSLLPGPRKEGDVEMYDDVHYFTITGRLLPGFAQTIENRPKELKFIHARFLGGGQDASVPITPDPSRRRRQAGPGANGWEALLHQMRGAELTPADLEVIQRLKAGRYGELYRLLFMGDLEGAGRLRKQGPYRSQSEADQALLNRLARLTDGSPARMSAIFQESKLSMRDKVKDHHTYLARTIQKAIEGRGWRLAQASTRGRGRR